MKLMLLSLVLAASTAQASTYDWKFRLADGTPAIFEMVGTPSYCFITAANATFTITAGSQVYTSTLCQQSSNPEQYFGQFANGADNNPGAFMIDIGSSYRNLMKQFQQYGGGGELGNSPDGNQCAADAVAFLTLPGSSLGDQDVVGYCMSPRNLKTH